MDQINTAILHVRCLNTETRCAEAFFKLICISCDLRLLKIYPLLSKHAYNIIKFCRM